MYADTLMVLQKILIYSGIPPDGASMKNTTIKVIVIQQVARYFIFLSS